MPHSSKRQGLTDSDFDHLVAIAIAAGAIHTAELLEVAKRGYIRLCSVFRGAKPPLGFKASGAVPLVIVLGDDDRQSTGPAGWACASDAIQMARCAVLHSCLGTAGQGHLVATMATSLGTCLLVETDPEHAGAWALELDKAAKPYIQIAAPSAEQVAREAGK